jgi:hypothetical protein
MLQIKTCLIALILTFFSLFTVAQQVEVGAKLGAAGYIGDLNPYNPLKFSGPSGGIFAKLNFTPHWGLGLHYNFGQIEGDDAKSNVQQFRDRNLSFKTSLNEASLILDFNLFDLYAYNRKGRITPYLFGGFGAVWYHPTAEFNGNTYELREYNTEGLAATYKDYALTFPYGAGLRYKMKSNWAYFFEIGYRTALTDYLDDVSGVYANPTAWTGNSAQISKALADRSGEQTGVYLGDPGSQRGDFRKRDNYMFVGIGISYTFVSQKCFTF